MSHGICKPHFWPGFCRLPEALKAAQELLCCSVAASVFRISQSCLLQTLHSRPRRNLCDVRAVPSEGLPPGTVMLCHVHSCCAMSITGGCVSVMSCPGAVFSCSSKLASITNIQQPQHVWWTHAMHIVYSVGLALITSWLPLAYSDFSCDMITSGQESMLCSNTCIYGSADMNRVCTYHLRTAGAAVTGNSSSTSNLQKRECLLSHKFCLICTLGLFTQLLPHFLVASCSDMAAAWPYLRSL